MADEQTPPLQPKSFLNIHQPVLSTHLYQVHQPTEAHRQQVHWQQQQQLWSQQLHQQQHPIVSHQNVQEIWQDTSPRFSQVWHPAHQQATSTIPIASHHQLITTPAQAITVDQSHNRNQFFDQHQENHGQLHVGIPNQDINREQHQQLTRDHTQPIGRTSPNMQFYQQQQQQQTNHHQRLEYWQQQHFQEPQQQHHSPNPDQRLHSPALQTSKAAESSTPSSHLMWQNPQATEQRQQSPIPHHQTPSTQVTVEHRQPSQEVPSSAPSSQPVLVPHPGWQQLTPTNIPQLQLLQQQMQQQGQAGQTQNQQELVQQQLMFIHLQQMYQQQVLAAQLAAHQMQQQQQQNQDRNEDKSTPHQPVDKPTPPHQPLFGQFNKPHVSVPEVKKPEVSSNLPERSVDTNQFALNNPQLHAADPFKQHRTIADSVPKAHVLPMKSETRATEAVNVQPSADATNKLKVEPVVPPAVPPVAPPAAPTPEKPQQPSPKLQSQTQQDPLKPYESVFLKREQQFQANQAQRRAAQMAFLRPQGTPTPGPGLTPGAPFQRLDNRSNFPPPQAQQGSWKAAFNRPMTQPPPLSGQKPGLPPKEKQDFKPPSWQDRSNKRSTEVPAAPISQQVLPPRPHSSGPPLPQRQSRQSKVVSKESKDQENKQWYNPYSASSQPDLSKSGQKTDPFVKFKTDKKDADFGDQSGVRALKGRLPGSYPGDQPEPRALSSSLVLGDKGNVNLSGPVFNPHPNEMPYYKEPSAPGSYPYPAGQRPKSEPLLRRALSEEGEQGRKLKEKKMPVGDGRCRLVVKGINPITSRESLQNYFEVMAKEDVDDDIFFNTDRTEALIVMDKKPDLTSLRKVIKDKKLEDRNLTVHEISKIKSIVVSSEKDFDKTDAILFYFERSQVGGPLASDIVKKTTEGFLILDFEDENSVVKICKPGKTHTVEGKTLRVSPYYRHQEGGIWDYSIHTTSVPKPFSINLEPYQIDFLKKELDPDELNATIAYTSNSVKFTCALKQSDRNYHWLARQWESFVRDEVMKQLTENIDCVEKAVPSDVWNRFIDWTTKFDRSTVQVKKDTNKKWVKFVSHPKILKELLHQADKQIAELQRVARRKSNMKKIDSVDKIKILETQGTFDEICKKFSDMLIHVKGTEITVEGNPEDLNKAFVKIFEECDSIQPGKFKHYRTQEFVSFVNSKAIKKHVQDNLNKKRFKGRWEINSSEIVVFSAEGSGDPHSICKEILNLVSEEKIPVKKDLLSILESKDWKSLKDSIKKTHRDKVDLVTTETPEIIVMGILDLTNIVKDVKSWIDDRTVKQKFIKCDPLYVEFICKCWKTKDFNDIEDTGVKISVRDDGISVSGTSKAIEAAESELETRLKQICKKTKTLERIAVCDAILTARGQGTLNEIEDESRCLVKLPGEMDGVASFSSLFDREQTTAAEIDEKGDSGGDAPFSGVLTSNNNIKIRLVKGEIGQQKCDTIVCSTSAKLNLNSGAAHSLIKQGGSQLQDECKQKYPEGIKNGQLAVIDGGKLKCDKVYLTALPEWKDAKGGKVLKDFMSDCLRQSEKRRKRSIVFNAMGTGGYLCYPKDAVAKLMYNAVSDFDSRQPRTWLKEVTFCVYGQDKDTVRAFEDQEHSRQMMMGSAALPKDYKKGDVTIKVVTDDLATLKVDAVLCSVSENMNLSNSGLCKTLLKQGGKSLQDECASRHNNKLPSGKVVDIGGGKLPCKVVLLANLPKYTAESTKQTLMDVLNEAFLKASTKNCKSIAIPALGTGFLNYPATTVAKCMYDAVVNWESNKPKTQLKSFTFVLYSKNIEVMQAFQSCWKKLQGREERAGRHLEGEGPKQTKDSKYQLHGNTCTIGPAKLEVVIGDVLGEKVDAIVNGLNSNCELQGAIAAALQNRCPNLNKEFAKKGNSLKRDGVASTGASGLVCKHIIHVQFQETQTAWTKKMVSCLREAEKLKAKSVAFPVLGAGTGAKSFQPDVIAECLFDAVDEYSGRSPRSCIKDIRLIVYYQNSTDKPKIMTSLQCKVKAGNSQSGARKFVRKVGDALSDKMAEIGMMRHRGLRSVHEKRQVMADMSSVDIQIVSDTYANIDRCWDLLNAEIDKAYVTKPVAIVEDLAKSLSEAQLEEMIDPSILVDVKIDKRGARIVVSGIAKNVLAAQDAIHKRCRDYEKEKHTKIEADILYNQIRWHFEEITATEVKEIEYGKNSNLKIETAYKGCKDSVELRDTEGKVYVVDLKELIEYLKDDKTDKVRVIRKDILKGARLSLPAKWAPMQKDVDFQVVHIDNKSQEYKDIEKEFTTQVNSGPYANKIPNKQNIKVVKIERIQNRTLYEMYEAKKKNMSSQKHRKNKLERFVWHGTDANVITSIERNGFNRSYCGKHGTYFGEGVYFAGDASYSAQSYLTGAQTGQTANRYIFYVKALTGEFTKGNKGMRVLPPINPGGDKTVVYDCAVDDKSNPMEFVIFHDTQAYPEYLITYVG